MKYQCAKCETIFEHEKYLTECDGEKTCPICDTMEVVYKLSNRFEQQVKPTLAEVVEDIKFKIDTSLDDFLNHSDAHVSEYHKEIYKIMAVNEKEICDEILAEYNSKCSL